MPAAYSTVRVGRPAGAVVFQVEGVARMPQGLALRRAAEEALAEGAAVRVDLRRCTYMDSTFVGTLLVLRRAAAGRDLALVEPAAPCRALLCQMGLDRVLPVVPAAGPPADDWPELPCAGEDMTDHRDQVVQAHAELATIEGPAGDPFRAVVRCLARDARK